MAKKKQIAAGEKVALKLSGRDRELITEHTFAGDDLTDRLRIVPKPGQPPVYRFTLADLDELAGYVAAEANHAKSKKLERELDRLYARIAAILKSIRMRMKGRRADWPTNRHASITSAPFVDCCLARQWTAA